MAAGQLAYADASALVKLVVREPESAALAYEVAGWERLACSEIGEVEMVRAARRRGPDALAAARRQLAATRLVPLSAEIRRVAGAVGDPALRSLDAVHLATALALGDDCDAMFVYDQRLARAAAALGLPVRAPA